MSPAEAAVRARRQVRFATVDDASGRHYEVANAHDVLMFVDEAAARAEHEREYAVAYGLFLKMGESR